MEGRTVSTSATVRNGRSGEKTRVSPCNTTSWNLFCRAVAHKFQLKVSTCNGGFRPNYFKLYLTRKWNDPNVQRTLHINERKPRWSDYPGNNNFDWRYDTITPYSIVFIRYHVRTLFVLGRIHSTMLVLGHGGIRRSPSIPFCYV